MYTVNPMLPRTDVTTRTTDLGTSMAYGTGDRMTEWAAVADHGDTLDEVRANGLISACLGCGSTVAVARGTAEAERVTTRDAVDWDAVDCCPMATRILY